ncbi:lysosomal-associated transmembrane protein 4B-like [Portunus trituberculatus]|uniref:lysosomal-associated transmembrane protein 4B-like n=1 Tax=Portunus trituberculatus TaxID=210409 RepID=UPI001E1CFDC7|nr:lysosomal-associated transmembrane protein 4B-like [Portunus trituberculatus]
MWEPTKCCCCCDVRIGSIVIGVFHLVGGCLGILGGIQILTGDKSDLVITCQESEETSDCGDESWKIGTENFTGTEKTSAILSLVEACFSIIFSCFLLYGILKKKTAFFIPLMVIYVIQIGIMILTSVVIIILLLFLGATFGIVFFIATFLGLLIFFVTYCLLVIRAYYYQLKREKGHVHTALNDHHLEAPPYPASECPPYSGNAPPYPASECPPYPGNEVPPYPTCDVPLYPNKE